MMLQLFVYQLIAVLLLYFQRRTEIKQTNRQVKFGIWTSNLTTLVIKFLNNINYKNTMNSRQYTYFIRRSLSVDVIVLTCSWKKL